MRRSFGFGLACLVAVSGVGHAQSSATKPAQSPGTKPAPEVKSGQAAEARKTLEQRKARRARAKARNVKVEAELRQQEARLAEFEANYRVELARLQAARMNETARNLAVLQLQQMANARRDAINAQMYNLQQIDRTGGYSPGVVTPGQLPAGTTSTTAPGTLNQNPTTPAAPATPTAPATPAAPAAKAAPATPAEPAPRNAPSGRSALPR